MKTEFITPKNLLAGDVMIVRFDDHLGYASERHVVQNVFEKPAPGFKLWTVCHIKVGDRDKRRSYTSFSGKIGGSPAQKVEIEKRHDKAK